MMGHGTDFGGFEHLTYFFEALIAKAPSQVDTSTMALTMFVRATSQSSEEAFMP